MADYLQLKVSEGEESTDTIEEKPTIKKRKIIEKTEKTKKRKKHIESSDEDDEDDDEIQAAEEMKGFIADDLEEEEDRGDEEKSEKSAQEEPEELDEDDLDLIEENFDAAPNKKKRFVETFDSDEDEDDRTAIQRKLFGVEDDNEPSSRRHVPEYRASGSEEEGSDDNFIVNEIDGERGKKRRHHKKDRNIPEGALDEARDIFGVEEFNLNEFYDEELIDEEEEDILEEDVDGELVRRVKRKEKKVTLLDAMDPVELERGFLTLVDKKIMLEDKPERFLTRRVPVTEIDEKEVEAETNWIIRNAFNDSYISAQKTKAADVIVASLNEVYAKQAEAEVKLRNAIKETLRNIRNKDFETFFIAFYRKEHDLNCLSPRELWKIYEYDEKYCRIENRKNKMIELMRRMQRFLSESQSEQKKSIMEVDIFELETADTEVALADAYAQFSLYHGPDIKNMLEWEKAKKGDNDSTSFKYSSRTNRYQYCLQNGIGEFANKFGLSARHFAENLDWKRHDIEQVPETVETVTEKFVSEIFPDEKSVLEAAVFVVAKELSVEPLIRNKVRKAFIRRATISVRPTKAGLSELDSTYPVYRRRYLKNMPVKQLSNEDFLYFYKFKEAGLLTFSIHCDTQNEIEKNETLADEMLADGAYRKDDYTDLVEEWNKLREMAVKRCINEMLIPHFKRELEKKLLEEAKECVAEKCAEELARRIESMGFKPEKSRDDEEEDYEFAKLGEIRVMVIAYTDIREASFGVVVNEDGQIVDYVRLLHLLKRDPKFSDQPMNPQKKETLNLFKKIVERKRPHIIGLCVEDMEVMRLQRNLQVMIDDMLREGTIPHRTDVVLLEDDAAKVYMNSKQAMTEFPDYPPTLRRAVSAARFLVDPLIEIASLWNADEDIFCLQLHPLQNNVDKELISKALEREMMYRVCDVGVDVNRCIDNPHHANLLQFVPGLGPRKAYNLLKEISQKTHVLSNRTHLVTHLSMGAKVFMNCSAFIKIDRQRISDRTDDLSEAEPLDASRVHPETYDFARKIAIDALEWDDNADPHEAIEKIQKEAQKLRDLDLDAYADELERQGKGDKRAALHDIAQELQGCYRDRRKPFEKATEEQVLAILSRDTKGMVKEGSLIDGLVIRVQYRRLSDEQRQNSQPQRDAANETWFCQFCLTKRETIDELWDHMNNRDSRYGGCPGTPVGIQVQLDNGRNGFIPSKFISDDGFVDHPLNFLQVGKKIGCRVLKVDFEKMSICLSCRPSDLQEDNADYNNTYWDHDAEQEDNENCQLEKKRMNTDMENIVKRVIQHQAFHNISYNDAVFELSKKEQGECIIRPSSRGSDRLTATWKVAEGVYANVEIQEKDKDNVYSLGKKLIINGEEFEDLNEIIARYIVPMANSARDIVLYKYYFDVVAENRTEIEQKLRDERRINPARIPYVLTASTKFPGKFQISFAHPKYRAMLHEYMTVVPEGIRFRQRVFTSFEQLVHWFKANFNEMPQNGYR